MRSAANGHGMSVGNGPDAANGASGPYAMTIAGVPLNPVPEIWNGMAAKGSLS
jgi:hypothetical protein